MEAEKEPPPVAEGQQPAERGIDKFWADLNRRQAELQAKGLSSSVARDIAYVQHRIDNHWPPAWGDDLQVLIYGDFSAPTEDMEYPALGITVKAGELKGTVISSAMCVVAALVKVKAKTLEAVLDATKRINTLLGIWTLMDWGNRGPGWWCHLTAGSIAGVGGPMEDKGVGVAIERLEALPEDVKHKVRAALYWIRDPVPQMLEKFKDEGLRIYAGYWNAFECLVEAVCLLRPPTKMKKQDKLDGINRFLAERGGKLDIASLTECYRTFVDPGFVAKASHALRVCFGDRADGYIQECFRMKPDEQRLYAIRNAINHGDIDYEDIYERCRVEDRHHRLFMIVFGMIGRIIPFPCPVDPGPRD